MLYGIANVIQNMGRIPPQNCNHTSVLLDTELFAVYW